MAHTRTCLRETAEQSPRGEAPVQRTRGVRWLMPVFMLGPDRAVHAIPATNWGGTHGPGSACALTVGTVSVLGGTPILGEI
jgi:hypothetical protein